MSFKRVVLFILTIIMLASVVPSVATEISASYDETTQTLTISGSGDMDNYSYLSSPYYSPYYNNVKNIIISGSITSIGDYAFCKFSKLENVTLNEGLVKIGKLAFYSCPKLSTINLPSTLNTIERWAFRDCVNLKNITNNSLLTLSERSRRNGYISYYAGSELTTETISKVADYLLSDLKDNANLTDVQKALIVHDRIITRCEYSFQDLYSARVDLKNPLLLTVQEHGSIESVLLNKWAVCQGYAECYKYLMSKLNIECEVVTSDILNHAWNVVKIDGYTYNVDCTYDDPRISTEADSDLYGFATHTYFLKSDYYFQNDGNHTATDYTITATGGTDYDSDNVWDNINCAFALLNNNIYYFKRTSSKNTLCDYSGNKIFETPAYEFYPTVFAYDGALYFQTIRQIYRYVPGAKNAVIYYNLDTVGIYKDKKISDLKIFGFKLEDGKFMMEIGPTFALACNDNSYIEKTVYKRGDFDGNGVLTSGDAVALAESLSNIEITPNQPGDINDDALWNKKDASYLIKHLSNPSMYPLN